MLLAKIHVLEGQHDEARMNVTPDKVDGLIAELRQ